MPFLKILICGGGCAGPALAFWLANNGHDVTIVERYPALRASGAQIDLRAQGIEVVRRMGLMEAVRAKLVDEDGVALVDTHGRVHATILANKSGKGAQSLTSEYEIMRGDLVRILFEATKDKVKYIFGKTVEHFDQDENGVDVRLSDGTTDRYDLLVGADGQGSRIRQAILPPDAPDPLHRLGLYMAYWFIPRTESETSIRNMYLAPGSRSIQCRSHCATESQVYFTVKDDSQELRSISRASIETQKDFWVQRFQDAGWQAKRFIEGMRNADNFYFHEVAQVKIDSWHKGRVVLLADAAHCPSPFTAMGTTSAFVGAYVLAGEIEKSQGDVRRALQSYEKILRPFVDVIQQINTQLIRLACPKSEWGIRIVYFIFGWLAFLRIPQLLSRFSDENKGGWQLPDYPELRRPVEVH